MSEENARLMRQATAISVMVAFILIIVKLAAYVMTSSVALLSSLVDSILDFLASLLNLVAVRHALEPADREHRFGHGKAEPLAGLGQAAFISGSAIFLVFESINRIVHPQELEHTQLGIAVMSFSLIATLGLVSYQRMVVRKTASLAIHADSLHYISDVAVNCGVILALLISNICGWSYADPVVALLIVAYILHSAFHIARQSLDQLMDRELSDSDRETIKKIILEHPGVLAQHDLRTRASGQHIFIQAHIELKAALSLRDAHDIAEGVEKKLEMAFPNADIIIHQDPVD